MPIDERKDKDQTTRPDADQEAEVKDLSAKTVDQHEGEKVKGGRLLNAEDGNLPLMNPM